MSCRTTKLPRCAAGNAQRKLPTQATGPLGLTAPQQKICLAQPKGPGTYREVQSASACNSDTWASGMVPFSGAGSLMLSPANAPGLTPYFGDSPK